MKGVGLLLPLFLVQLRPGGMRLTPVAPPPFPFYPTGRGDVLNSGQGPL